MPRIARIVVAGHPYHVVQRGNNRQPVFFDDRDRLLYIALLKKYSLECSCKVHAYCIMNNHIHILFIPQFENSLAKAMQKLSLSFTQYINRKYRRTGRLWECRFHSTLVDKEAYLWSVCRYIERNPVRAKLVDKPDQYKWSSAKIDDSEKDIFVKAFWQNPKERKEYLDFLNQPDNKSEIEKIRKSTFSGKPIGTEKFIDHITKTTGIIINTKKRGRPARGKQ